MATSGNFEKTITSWLKLRVEWTAGTQNIAANKTPLTVTAYLVSTASNGVINSSASKTVNLTINGTTYSKTAAGLAKISGSQKKQLFSKTVDVAHNANGTKSCSISCSFGIQVTLGGTYYGTVSTSGTATLNTIPRASSIASISGSTIGSSVTVNITPASSAFTHKLYYTAPTQSDLVAIGTTAAGVTSATFTPSINDCSYIPNATSGTAKITLETYSGSTKLGTVSKTFTLNVPSSVKPTISTLTVADADTAIKNKFGVYVQTKSKAAVSITAAGAQSSTIKSYTTTLTNGSTVLTYNGASFTSGVLSLSGTYTIKTVVTDSRGRTAEKSTTINVVAYHPPEATALTAERRNSSNVADDEGTIVFVGLSYNISPVDNKNDRFYKLEYREASTTTWTVKTDKATIPSANFTGSFTIGVGSNFSIDKAYEIRVTIFDYFTSATRTTEVPTARTIFDILADGTGICFGGVASQRGVCQIDMQTHFKGGQINLNAQEENDLNQFTKPNVYVTKNQASSSYANIPDGFYGTYTIEVMSAGQEGQLLQRATLCSKEYPDIRERHYYKNTWGEWQRVGGIYPALTAHLAADAKTVKDTYTKIPLVQEFKLGNGVSISDGSILIGAGIKAVRVSANVEFYANGSGGNKHIRIKRGSDTVAWGTDNGVTGKSHLMTIPSKIISVQSGDLITLNYYSSAADDGINAGSSTNGFKTFMTVEVVA